MMVAERRQEPRGELLYDAPLATLNSWRVGGAAECLFRPADVEDLSGFLASGLAPGPLTWLGLGSNVLIRDGGVRGTVIAVHGGLSGLRISAHGEVEVEAGVPCAKVARQSAQRGLTGAEFLAGIPGTMGGALAMNAGAFGGETWAIVNAVTTMSADGGLRRRPPGSFEIGYRSVRGLEDEWFVAATLGLRFGDGQAAQAQIRELLARRSATQPMGVPSCGSVFRNPDNDHAARLIEACGLKGYCVGSACVAEKHANFIVNTGGATAADIESLIEIIQARVDEVFAIRLRPEVRVIGEPRR